MENEIAYGYQLTADDLSKRLHGTEEERDALTAKMTAYFVAAGFNEIDKLMCGSLEMFQKIGAVVAERTKALAAERDALKAELDRKTALYERVTDDFAGEVLRLKADLAKAREALEKIIHELGVPSPIHPAPVVNAWEIAQAYFKEAK